MVTHSFHGRSDPGVVELFGDSISWLGSSSFFVLNLNNILDTVIVLCCIPDRRGGVVLVTATLISNLSPLSSAFQHFEASERVMFSNIDMFYCAFVYSQNNFDYNIFN